MEDDWWLGLLQGGEKKFKCGEVPGCSRIQERAR